MANVGRLSVRVYSTRAQFPVEGATVAVGRYGDTGKHELISVQITDSSGMIHPIEIATPEEEKSTSPNGGNLTAPYALYNVWVEHPDFSMLQIKGVQIFPGVETVQDVEMLPLQDGQSSLQQRRTREFTTQNL